MFWINPNKIAGIAVMIGILSCVAPDLRAQQADSQSAARTAVATKSMKTIITNNSQELQQFFRYTGNDIPIISAHRGGMTVGYPENCIATFEHTLRHTPAFFEIDPRLTKDGVIVLMHDATLDRTTTGTGKVSDYTWAQLKELKLKDSKGNVTPYGIPTLEEVVVWSRGKAILNLDKKDVPMTMIAEKLREWKADSSVMVTVHNATQAKFYYDQDNNRMFSAFIRNKKEFDEFEAAGIPWTNIMAFVGIATKPETREIIELLHAKGVMCMISTAPSSDKLPTVAERKAAYQEIIKAGADVIETDRPIETAEAIAPLFPAQSEKQIFFGTFDEK